MIGKPGILSWKLTIVYSLSTFATFLVEETYSGDNVTQFDQLTLLVLLVHGHESSQLDGRKHALKGSSRFSDDRYVSRATKARSEQNSRDDFTIQTLKVVFTLGSRVGDLSNNWL